MRSWSWLACCLLYGMLGAVSAKELEAFIAQPDADGVQRVRIVGGDYFFMPSHVIVKVNMPVEFVLAKKRGVVPHSFVLEAPQAGMSVDVELDEEPKKVIVTPTAVGSYPFYCRNKLLFFKSHREKGMEGVLEVRP